MAFSRYNFTPRTVNGRGLITPELSNEIYQRVKLGQISVTPYMLKESERLDHIAYKKLGDASLWWVLAAASGIGWGLQCPPGTLVNIPTSMSEIYGLSRIG